MYWSSSEETLLAGYCPQKTGHTIEDNVLVLCRLILIMLNCCVFCNRLYTQGNILMHLNPRNIEHILSMVCCLLLCSHKHVCTHTCSERQDNEIAQEIQEELVRQAEQQRWQEEKDAVRRKHSHCTLVEHNPSTSQCWWFTVGRPVKSIKSAPGGTFFCHNLQVDRPSLDFCM